MGQLNRREFARLAAGTALAASAFGSFAIAQAGSKVVIIGGGAGGATVAHHLKKGSPKLDVTLVEVQPQYTTCFFSNLYLGGFRTLESLVHSYDGLKKLGVKVVHDLATAVDTSKKTVTLKGGSTLPYDRLVLSPGIDFKYDTIEGYSEAAAEKLPHAYKAGAQTKLLKSQLEAMPDGGTVVMIPPPDPFRCPPGPYERASMIGHFLKTKKPKSKLVILDPKEKFSKMGLFQEGWGQHYAGIVEWVPPGMSGGGAKKIDAAAMTVQTGDGETIKAAVINVIPPQKAGKIAELAGCTKGDWCPIKADSFASGQVADVYVLGDASIAAAMPKSGFSANSQAKVVANAIQAELDGKQKFPARFRNTCWSMISPDNSVKIGANYTPADTKLDAVDSFVSKAGEDAKLRAETFKESLGWYEGITADMFAKA
ncbi:MAG: NAD(P)/FAD-dependent oxidoreductase [Pseudomonadota bacterium]|nr:NAD(P)/FAD-dependent oxidoreductase [Pseudomonadota bacterium]